MENISDALLIAAGVLIGILVLSLAVYLFNTMGSHAANIQGEIDENEIAKFNDRFMKYDGATDITIQDVITVKNYALESNKKYSGYNYEQDRAENNNEYIDVFYDLADELRILIFTKSNEELLKEALDKKFTCEIKINETTQEVNRIYFSEVEED